MSKDIEIFEGKTIQDLSKDIYDNSRNKKKQIDILIKELHTFIQTAEDALMIAPIIKEYLDVSVKNDEHLVKLASVIQRYIVKSNNKDEGDFGLSDKEKQELFDTLSSTAAELQLESDKFNKLEQSSSKVMGQV
tara:strand:+ start:1848 stop:2249 length:402 start_codon:yes stop_codon:yes gene_type:complete